MSNKEADKKFPPKTASDELFDAIFGRDEDIAEKLGEEIMDSYGVSSEHLVESLKLEIQKRIKESRDETGAMPAELVAMLNNVRAYQKEKEPKAVGADEWISQIFNVSSTSSTVQPVYNLRTRDVGMLSEKDKKILNEMIAELEE
jgi:hypothetical protein